MTKSATQMQQAEDHLRRLILDMELGPGERLTERGVESMLGVSRTSVRTALFRLEAEGLVCRIGRGWRVPPIDLEEISQLCVYREALELTALRLAPAVIPACEIATIESLLESITPTSRPEELDQAGRDFHLWIAGLAKNRFVTQGVKDAMTRLRRARWLDNEPTHHGWDEHRSIIAALKNGERSQAIALMETHMSETRQNLLAALQKSQRSLRARGAILVSV
ncbi:GntR family transcriptional regulator [Acetobacter vaccinii]|uniref:GntR family transcriptional regulator n=1 Tax=Acetobacter vaccinii TaxID=2592655 RepID=A0A5C1YPF2_9PROT|nr:GntR family transcriptional regulator [Acetobacter vaccinii]QEO18206.1 GntR family transcriptional regulator [Acetobacter vaccinii]